MLSLEKLLQTCVRSKSEMIVSYSKGTRKQDQNDSINPHSSVNPVRKAMRGRCKANIPITKTYNTVPIHCMETDMKYINMKGSSQTYQTPCFFSVMKSKIDNEVTKLMWLLRVIKSLVKTFSKTQQTNYNKLSFLSEI